MTDIKLTPEEIQLIESKRKLEEELREKQEAADRKTRQQAHDEINKEINKADAIVKKLEEAFESFPKDEFEFVIEEVERKKWWYNYKREQMEIPFVVRKAKIESKLKRQFRDYEGNVTSESPMATITLQEWIPYGSWRAVSNGLRLYLNMRGYKGTSRGFVKPESVVAKYREVLKKNKQEQKVEQEKRTAIQVTLEKYTKMYPNAKVQKEHYYVSTRNRFDSYESVSVVFDNGVKVYIAPSSEGKEYTRSISIPNVGIENLSSLLNQLQSLNTSK